jgi:small subunit ribosomal protein S21
MSKHPNQHITVKVYGDGKSDKALEKALRVLKKKIQNDGLFKTLKLKRAYEKPSEKKRRVWRENAKRKR